MLRRLCTVTLPLLVLWEGCTSLQEVPIHPDAGAATEDVRVGSIVRVTLDSGESIFGRITSISPDTWTVDRTARFEEGTVSIATADVRSVQVRRAHPKRVAVIVATLVVVGAALVAYDISMLRP